MHPRASQVLWRRSWDGQRHAYAGLGELTSTAVCAHVGRTSSCVDDPTARRCPACTEITSEAGTGAR
ncbi:hypothetical protein [Actinophytocola sediminis]